VAGDDAFLASVIDTELYSVAAYFHDRHPELVDDVVAQSEDIERRGLRAYADDADMGLETAFQTLLTGLAVRYYRALNG
jgi:hypothetical protein